MYIYHKQCEIKQKFNETAQTANFTDFQSILCGNGPKGTKTMLGRPGLSENVVFFVATIF